jgi:DNA-binding Lrp family transcriptional regulator
MIAYVLINTKPEVIDEVLGLVKKIDNVTEAYAVHGLYDIVAKIEAETEEILRNTVTWKIKQLYGIRSAFILIANENINSSKKFYFVPA